MADFVDLSAIPSIPTLSLPLIPRHNTRYNTQDSTRLLQELIHSPPCFKEKFNNTYTASGAFTTFSVMAALGDDLLSTVNKLQDLVFNTIGNDSLDLPQIVCASHLTLLPA